MKIFGKIFFLSLIICSGLSAADSSVSFFTAAFESELDTVLLTWHSGSFAARTYTSSGLDSTVRQWRFVNQWDVWAGWSASQWWDEQNEIWVNSDYEPYFEDVPSSSFFQSSFSYAYDSYIASDYIVDPSIIDAAARTIVDTDDSDSIPYSSKFDQGLFRIVLGDMISSYFDPVTFQEVFSYKDPDFVAEFRSTYSDPCDPVFPSLSSDKTFTNPGDDALAFSRELSTFAIDCIANVAGIMLGVALGFTLAFVGFRWLTKRL